jgi:hypothetical protein
VTTSDESAESILPADDDFAIDIEAPVADAVEQRAPVLPTEEDYTSLPTELPADANPADAIEQAMPVLDDPDEVAGR